MLILFFTIVQIIVSATQGSYEFPIHTTIVRVLKFIKSVQLVKSAKSFKNIAKTLIITVPSLGNIAFLLVLLMVFYSILGMNVFGRVEINGSLNHHTNF